MKTTANNSDEHNKDDNHDLSSTSSIEIIDTNECEINTTTDQTNSKVKTRTRPKKKAKLNIDDENKLICRRERRKFQRQAAQKSAIDEKKMNKSADQNDLPNEQDWESYFRYLFYHDEVVHKG